MPSWPSSLAKNRADSSSSSSKRSGGAPARSSRLVSASAAGAPAVRCDQLGAHLAVDVGVGHHEVDQPAGRRRLGVEDLAGQHQPVRHVRHHPRQDDGAR